MYYIYTQDTSAADCSAELYIGEECQSVLAARQSCIPGRENSAEVFVLLPQSQQVILEQQLAALQQLVTVSPDCESELLSFLCVEVFGGFCDGASAVHRTTRQECERITTTVCATEFQQILPLLKTGGFELSCDTFPESTSICTSKSDSTHAHASREAPTYGNVNHRSPQLLNFAFTHMHMTHIW